MCVFIWTGILSLFWCTKRVQRSNATLSKSNFGAGVVAPPKSLSVLAKLTLTYVYEVPKHIMILRCHFILPIVYIINYYMYQECVYCGKQHSHWWNAAYRNTLIVYDASLESRHCSIKCVLWILGQFLIFTAFVPALPWMIGSHTVTNSLLLQWLAPTPSPVFKYPMKKK